MKDTNLTNERFNQYESNITDMLSKYEASCLIFNGMITDY